ncbi:MAG TPA: hypothetical protein EYP09_07195 [Anaerolineae bacterium]|nr:hypothetical protein [Anaerolineae bacterium]
MVKVTIELVGTARIRAKRKEVSLAVEEDATWRDVVAALAQEVPALIGQSIAEDKHDLISPHQFNFGGCFIAKLDEKAQLKEGDRISLLEGTC